MAVECRYRWILAAILLVTLAVYARSFSGGFTYDDRVFVMVPNSHAEPNFMVGQVQPLGLYFQRHYGHGCGEGGRGYRPVSVLSFAMVHALFEDQGTGPEGSDCPSGPHHVVGVLLHLLGVALTWRMVARFTGGGLPALLAATVFGLHALRSDPVISIVGRAEILGHVFGAGALSLYVAALQRGGGLRYLLLGLSGLLLFCACGSKEGAFAWAVFVPLYAVTLDCHRRPGITLGGSLRQQALALVPAVLLPLAVSLGLYFHLQGLLPAEGFQAASQQNPVFAAPWLVRVLTGVLVLGYGLYKVLVPWHLACDYGVAVFTPATSILDPRFLVALLVLVGVLVVSLRMFRRQPLLFLGMASFLGFTFLTSNIPLPIETIFAERLYYTPALGASFLAAWGAVQLAGRRRWLTVLVLVVGAWCAVGGYLIVQRCEAWQSNDTLFATDADGQPRSLAMRMAVARKLRLRGEATGWQDEQLRQQWYQNLWKAYQIEPRSPLALNMLAYYHLQSGELEKAEQYVREALASPFYHPRHDGMKLYWQLSEIAERRGNLELAEEHLRSAIAIHPPRVEAHMQLAHFLQRNGRQREGEALLAALLRRFAGHAQLRWTLIHLVRARGDRQRVAQLLQQGVAVRPDVGGFALELGLLHLQERRLEAAAELLGRALAGRLAPADRRRCLLPLAGCLEALGRHREAVQILQQALADPQLSTEGRTRIQRKIRQLEGGSR